MLLFQLLFSTKHVSVQVFLLTSDPCWQHAGLARKSVSTFQASPVSFHQVFISSILPWPWVALSARPISAFHPSGVGEWVVIHVINEPQMWWQLNGRLGLCIGLWLQAKVPDCGFGLQPGLYVWAVRQFCLWWQCCWSCVCYSCG